MPAIFNPMVLTWKGDTYTVPPESVMGAIATVENVITLGELTQADNPASIPMSRLAMAYGAAMRYAGARVSDAEIYAGMFGLGGESSENVIGSVKSLLFMMLPKDLGGATEPAKKRVGARKAPMAKASSRKRTKRRSVRAG